MVTDCEREAGRLLTPPHMAVPSGISGPSAASSTKVLGTHGHLVSLGSAHG